MYIKVTAILRDPYYDPKLDLEENLRECFEDGAYEVRSIDAKVVVHPPEEDNG